MKNLMKKKLNKKGFTLAELLIVVAIIAVLAAIAIPMFTAQLTKARAGVDLANLRSAISVASYDLLTNQKATEAELQAAAEAALGGSVTSQLDSTKGGLSIKISDTTPKTIDLDKTTLGGNNLATLIEKAGETAATTTTENNNSGGSSR